MDGQPPSRVDLDTKERRWDIDEVGHGVASGELARPELARLDAALAAPDWIAEQPDAHLLPHIRRACEAPGSGLSVVDWRIEHDVLVVDLRADPDDSRRRRPPELLLPVVGTFIEPSSMVRIDERPDGTTLDVATGVLAGDTEFAPHGHLVRLRLIVG